MAKRIYVGNLPFSATESEVRELFEPHGTVYSVTLVEDRETGQPRRPVSVFGDARQAFRMR